MSKRRLLFIRDVIIYSLTAFGGPQAHLSMMLRDFVHKRRYISEEELLELNALCQLLPGPASTQTIIAIAYKLGGLGLAILTFFIWILPSAAILCLAGVFFNALEVKDQSLGFLKYIQPMAVGFVAFAAFSFGKKTFFKPSTLIMACCAMVVTVIFRSAYVFPSVIIFGGLISYLIHRNDPSEENEKTNFHLGWKKFWIFAGVLLFAAALGAVVNRTSPLSLPIRLFENFYRNGAIIFGGGQVMIPVMFTEFVQMKHYLNTSEFLTGVAIQQAMPGPVFSFSSFIGSMAMRNSGIMGQIAGGFIAVLGINLPGVILIFFIIPFWDNLKKISVIKKSLWGINAVALGFMLAAFIVMMQLIGLNYQSLSMVALTFLLLKYTRIPAPVIILIGLGLGFLL